jgi:hypothetical protein
LDSALASFSFNTDHPIAAITIPPESCTMGKDTPKKLRMAAPRSSMIARKITFLMAILRARERLTFGGAAGQPEENQRRS